MPKRLWVVGLPSLLAAACSSSPVTQPPLAPCTATSRGQVSLGLSGYTAVDPTQTAGCAVFPANIFGSTIEYLVVPQSASSIPDDSQAFKLGGNPLAAPLPPGAPLAGPSAAQQFDLRLRLAEREFAAQIPRPLRAPPRAPALVTPVDSGNVRTFKVCNVLACDPRKPSTLSSVTATALKVGTHIAIYVDNAAPQPGLTQSDLDNLRAVFDTRLYETDTLAFGRESDIDSNGMVIVLMTGKVNALVTSAQCTNPTGGYVAGYFFGADLITTPPFATGNGAEIFYSIVPDPSGTLSCAHSVVAVSQIVPVTFVHEFQHMISFNQHFLVRGNFPEDLWLNEGLSHYAEENGGRTFLPDTGTFCRYVFGDLYNSAQYFTAPHNYFLVDTAGIGGLANRGAYWLFVRYLVDQVGATLGSADSATRRLDGTALTGAANVSNATGGTAFPTVLAHWGLANYVSDLSLPGFIAPPELRYVTWKFRTDYQTMKTACAAFLNTGNLPSQLPLVPPVLDATSAQGSGMLHAGSGSYYRLQHAAGAPGFTLLFSNSAGGALRTTLVPRLNVIRIQ
ncbi:MAG: hypothetical protein DMD70_05245 [Gemmatimonadetes bacterium]|nr:MAG: hypothetical protein DMD70_05245 [Gemmatimonadota bacterium]